MDEIMRNQLFGENFDWKTQQGKIVVSNKIFRKYQMIQAKLIDILIIQDQNQIMVEQGQFQI
ncbi:unnamed protein product [Paramecium primaurelia]|uniref:Uncharacterized protein n=1 Tax=Paramecium primaurelia TaxID=5886 RepID=A0A8S1NDJ3_PARPR|nr:unnamed protein product [Paramecium primaurelia]